MNRLILIAVVGILGSAVLCWVIRTVVVCVTAASSAPVTAMLERKHDAADGELAAMIARNHQGTLGGSLAAQSAHERLAKAVRYSGGRSKSGHT